MEWDKRAWGGPWDFGDGKVSSQAKTMNVNTICKPTTYYNKATIPPQTWFYQKKLFSLGEGELNE